MDTDCPHEGDLSRKFGGAIVCEDCSQVIGSWREPQLVLSMDLSRPEV